MMLHIFNFFINKVLYYLMNIQKFLLLAEDKNLSKY